MNRKIYFRLSVFLLIIAFSEATFAQVDLQDSNLPIIIIDTEGATISDEPKISAHMGVIDNGVGQRNAISDPFNAYDGLIGIEFRGSSSQQFYDKKSMAVETRLADGSNNNVSLLGMPAENDWVLYGPYGDKSLIRNALAYQLAGLIMDYAPRTRFCEVIINGEYRGIYLFTEKIKRDDNRVDISKLKVEDNEGDELTGGYILKIDKSTGSGVGGWDSNYPPQSGAWQSTYFQYHYPKPENITDSQRDYIQGFINDFDDLMQSPDFADSISGYRNYIDYTTFIDFILINEMCKNVDAYRLSTFLYKDKNSVDGRLKVGPVWDFNLGFGNVNFCAGPSPEGWVLDYNSICPEDGWLIHFWWKRFMTDAFFVSEIKKRWKELRESLFSDESIVAYIDELASEIDEATNRNFDKWPILNEEVWPNSYVGGSHNNEISFLKDWLYERMEWMDEAFNQLEPPYQGIGEGAEILVFPNPFRDQVVLEFEAPSNSKVTIYLYDALGQVVDFQVVDLSGTFFTNSFKQRYGFTWSSSSPPGMYFYSIIYWDEVQYMGSLLKY